MSTATAIKGVAILALAIGMLWLVRMLPTEQVQRGLAEISDRLGLWAYIGFVLLYALATICLIPASALTLAAGAVFGLGLGFALVSVGSTLGAAVAFLIARYLAREKVAQMANSNAKLSALYTSISDGGWKVVALLRLSPAIPFTWQNYFYGLTNLRFWPYVATSWIAMMPGTLMYVYLGHVAGATATGATSSIGRWSIMTIGLAATVAVTLYITHLAKKRLHDRTATAHQQTDNKQHQEDEEQDLSDGRRSSRHHSKTQYTSDQSDY